MKEIIEMIQMLQSMSTETYMKYRYMAQAFSHNQNCVEDFIEKLFCVADRHRPLQIEDKERNRKV